MNCDTRFDIVMNRLQKPYERNRIISFDRFSQHLTRSNIESRYQ